MPSCSGHRSVSEAPNRLWSPSSFSRLTFPHSTNTLPVLQTHGGLYFSIVYLPKDLWGWHILMSTSSGDLAFILQKKDIPLSEASTLDFAA